jgi:hypothetical protein
MGHQRVTLDCVVNVRETSMYILSKALKKPMQTRPLAEPEAYAFNFSRQRQIQQSVGQRDVKTVSTASRNERYLYVLDLHLGTANESTPFTTWMEHLDDILNEVDRDRNYMHAMTSAPSIPHRSV